jgi:hypothetical protein
VAFTFSPVPAKKRECLGALAVMLTLFLFALEVAAWIVTWLEPVMQTLFLFARPIFKGYFARPNDMTYSFGGDALVLYCHTSYHARYGDGLILHGMNHPDGE